MRFIIFTLSTNYLSMDKVHCKLIFLNTSLKPDLTVIIKSLTIDYIVVNISFYYICLTSLGLKHLLTISPVGLIHCFVA